MSLVTNKTGKAQTRRAQALSSRLLITHCTQDPRESGQFLAIICWIWGIVALG